MIQEQYRIKGMSCAACSAAVERVTKKLEGVQNSEVNLTTEIMTIVYDPVLTNKELIIAKVKKAGFGCELFETIKQSDEGIETGTQKESGKDSRLQDPNKILEQLEADEEENIKPPRLRGRREDWRKKEQEETKARIKAKRRRLIVTMILAGCLLYISMGHMLPIPLPLPEIMRMETYPINFALTQLLLTIPVLFLNFELFVSGVKSLKNMHPNMNALVTIGCVTSFVYSLIVTYLISVDPNHVHELYYESSAVVVAFVSFGKYLEINNKEKTKNAIYGLMALVPETAYKIVNDTVKEVLIEEVALGDILLVKPGNRIPVDGIVVEGESNVDEAMLTGESIPIQKTTGDVLIGGSVNQNGALSMEVTKVGEDTTLSKIIRFVEDAQGKKAPISKVADRVAGVFVPVVIALACIAALIWGVLGYEIAFVLKIFTAVLVIACPCALGLATPTAIMVGSGLGAKYGVLVRSGEALEQICKVTSVVFDKTGTITKGEPEVVDICVKEKVNSRDVLFQAALVETMSDHPLAQAVVNCYQTKYGEISGVIAEFENISGKGIRAKIQKSKENEEIAFEEIFVGNVALMKDCNVDLSAWEKECETISCTGSTLLYVAKSKMIQGIILVSDTVKETSKNAVEELKDKGIKVCMITGDRESAANDIAQQVGIDTVFSEVLPEEKAGYIQKLQQDGEIVMMVGDGINDAPALAQADIGCAIGDGSDIALESGDVVLMKSDLLDVVRAMKLSKLTIRNVKQNLFWAFCYNVIGIPIAAGMLYPITGQLLSPHLAGMAMSLSSVCVVSNALRLGRKKL